MCIKIVFMCILYNNLKTKTHTYSINRNRANTPHMNVNT